MRFCKQARGTYNLSKQLHRTAVVLQLFALASISKGAISLTTVVLQLSEEAAPFEVKATAISWAAGF